MTEVFLVFGICFVMDSHFRIGRPVPMSANRPIADSHKMARAYGSDLSVGRVLRLLIQSHVTRNVFVIHREALTRIEHERSQVAAPDQPRFAQMIVNVPDGHVVDRERQGSIAGLPHAQRPVAYKF